MVLQQGLPKVYAHAIRPIEFFRTSNVYLSFQMAYGYPILFDVESTLNEPNDLLLMEDEYSEYITDLIEHNVHYNRTGAETQFFQFNGLIRFSLLKTKTFVNENFQKSKSALYLRIFIFCLKACQIDFQHKQILPFNMLFISIL
ncbi:MAG: hypothetical protein R2769_16885 [Saprospiraceae bacterium]